MGREIEIEQKSSNTIINIVLDTLKMNKQALVFANTKRSAEKTAEEIALKLKGDNEELKELSGRALNVIPKPTKQCERLANCLKKGIAFHHAGLHNRQKEIIEENFKAGVIKIICCTPTLCLAKDTMIWHGTEETEVSRLNNSNPLFVLSNSKLIPMKAQKVERTKNSSKLIQISSLSGYFIKVTPNHKLYIKRELKKIILPAHEIKISDKIATIGHIALTETISPKIEDFIKDNLLPINITLNPHIAYLIGAMIGDGYSGAETINGKIVYKSSPSIVGKDEEIFSRVITACKEIGIPYRRSSTFHETPQLVLGKHKWFREFLCRCGIEKGENKYISTLVMNSKENIIAGLLQGLFDTDGFVQKYTKNIGFSSISSKLIKNMQKLMLRFGIVSTIRRREASVMKIYDKSYATKPSYELLINQKICINRFYQNIGFSVKRKQDALKNILEEFSSNIHYIACNKCDYKLYRDLFGGRSIAQKEWGKRKLEVIKLLGKNDELGSRELANNLRYEPKKKELRLNHHYQLIFKRRVGSRSRTEWYWSLKPIGKWLYSSLSHINFSDILSMKNCPLCNRPLIKVIKKGWRNSDFEGDIFWDIIKEIKIVDSEEDVYDVVLPPEPKNNHMFVAEGFIVHNSYGMDLPAFRAVIKDLRRYGTRGLAWIPVLDYLQMSGRAGRPSYDTEGQAIAIAFSEADKEFIFDKYIKGSPEKIYSKLAVEPVLRTYLLSLIATNLVRDKAQIMDFFSRTFWSYQFKDLEHLEIIIAKMLELLEEFEFIKVSGRQEESKGFINRFKKYKEEFVSANEIKNESYAATILGKRVSELYIDPLSAYKIIEGLRSASARKIKSIALLQLISNTLEMEPLLGIRSKERDKIEQELAKNEIFLLQREPSLYDADYDDYIKSFKTALFFENWISEKDEEFLLEEFNIRPGETRAKIQIADWLLFCAEEFARLLQFKEMIREILKLGIRIEHGIKEELLPLVRLEGIGRIRARVLYNNRIRDLGDLRKADEATLNALLGRKIADNVRKQLGTEIEKIHEGKRKGQINLEDFRESYGDG